MIDLMGNARQRKVLQEKIKELQAQLKQAKNRKEYYTALELNYELQKLEKELEEIR